MTRDADDVRKAKDVAVAANKSKTEFLAMMSHELRTPLNVILGFSEIIRSEALGKLGAEEYKEYADDIYTSGAHLLALINDLLDLAKVESGMVNVRDELLDVSELIDNSIRIIAKTEAAPGVSLHAEATVEMPPLGADKRKMRQILINILSNAAKFTPEGQSVPARTYLNADGEIVFEVQDTGIGIASEDIEKVLEPFVQIDSSLNRAHSSTGLGLPLCRQLTELLGGVFHIESAVNQGTTVRVVMPASRTHAARAGGRAA
jgi:two-component system cell cycle sensor histidine kinase PleC